MARASKVAGAMPAPAAGPLAAVSFYGYPHNDTDEVFFMAGTLVSGSAEFIDMLRGKGLLVDVASAAAEPRPQIPVTDAPAEPALAEITDAVASA